MYMHCVLRNSVALKRASEKRRKVGAVENADSLHTSISIDIRVGFFRIQFPVVIITLVIVVVYMQGISFVLRGVITDSV